MTLWALSGFSVLTLELVWMRELALWAGNTVIASTLVIAVFFSAAALGNLWGDGWMSPVAQRLPPSVTGDRRQFFCFRPIGQSMPIAAAA